MKKRCVTAALAAADLAVGRAGASTLARIVVGKYEDHEPLNRQKKIFEEFHQVENLGRDRSQGLGLGLSIVRRLCDLYHWEVSVAPRPERGAVATLVFEA